MLLIYLFIGDESMLLQEAFFCEIIAAALHRSICCRGDLPTLLLVRLYFNKPPSCYQPGENVCKFFRANKQHTSFLSSDRYSVGPYESENGA